MGWQEDYYGKAYKSQSTYNAAQKRKKTNEKKEQRDYRAYDNATQQKAKEFAKANGIKYDEKFYNSYNKAVTNKFREQDYNELNAKHQKKWNEKSSVTGDAPYRLADEYETKHYNQMRKELGYSKSSTSVSHAEYDRLNADYNERKKSGTANFLKDIKDGYGVSGRGSWYEQFTRKADKKLDGVAKSLTQLAESKTGKVAKKVFDNEYVKDVTGSINPFQSEVGKKIFDKLDQYTYAPLKNMAQSNIDDLKQVDTSKKLETQSASELFNQLKKDTKDAYSGKRRDAMPNFNNTGVSTGSKYGDKALTFATEIIADPTNLIGAGVFTKVGKLGKAITGTGEIGKIAHEQQLLLDAPKNEPYNVKSTPPKQEIINMPNGQQLLLPSPKGKSRKTIEFTNSGKAKGLIPNKNISAKDQLKRILQESYPQQKYELGSPELLGLPEPKATGPNGPIEMPQPLQLPAPSGIKAIVQKMPKKEQVNFDAQLKDLEQLHEIEKTAFAENNPDLIQNRKNELEGELRKQLEQQIEFEGHQKLATEYDNMVKAIKQKSTVKDPFTGKKVRTEPENARIYLTDEERREYGKLIPRELIAKKDSGKGQPLDVLAQEHGFNDIADFIHFLNKGKASKQVVKGGKENFVTQQLSGNVDNVVDDLFNQSESGQRIKQAWDDVTARKQASEPKKENLGVFDEARRETVQQDLANGLTPEQAKDREVVRQLEKEMPNLEPNVQEKVQKSIDELKKKEVLAKYPKNYHGYHELKNEMTGAEREILFRENARLREEYKKTPFEKPTKATSMESEELFPQVNNKNGFYVKEFKFNAPLDEKFTQDLRNIGMKNKHDEALDPHTPLDPKREDLKLKWTYSGPNTPEFREKVAKLEKSIQQRLKTGNGVVPKDETLKTNHQNINKSDDDYNDPDYDYDEVKPKKDFDPQRDYYNNDYYKTSKPVKAKVGDKIRAYVHDNKSGFFTEGKVTHVNEDGSVKLDAGIVGKFDVPAEKVWENITPKPKKPIEKTVEAVDSMNAQKKYDEMKEKLTLPKKPLTDKTKLKRLKEMRDFAEKHGLEFSDRFKNLIPKLEKQIEAAKPKTEFLKSEPRVSGPKVKESTLEEIKAIKPIDEQRQLLEENTHENLRKLSKELGMYTEKGSKHNQMVANILSRVNGNMPVRARRDNSRLLNMGKNLETLKNTLSEKDYAEFNKEYKSVNSDQEKTFDVIDKWLNKSSEMTVSKVDAEIPQNKDLTPKQEQTDIFTIGDATIERPEGMSDEEWDFLKDELEDETSAGLQGGGKSPFSGSKKRNFQNTIKEDQLTFDQKKDAYSGNIKQPNNDGPTKGIKNTDFTQKVMNGQLKHEKGVISDPSTGGNKRVKDAYAPKGDTQLSAEWNISPKEKNTLKEEFIKTKDIKPLEGNASSLPELIRHLPKTLHDKLTNVLNKGKESNVDMMIKETSNFLKKVVSSKEYQVGNTKTKGLGIRKGTKHSKYVSQYGEQYFANQYFAEKKLDPSQFTPEQIAQINRRELRKVAGKKADDIIKAHNFFYNKYVEYIDKYNEVRQGLGLEPIAKRKSTEIYRHFQDLQDLNQVKNTTYGSAGNDIKFNPDEQGAQNWKQSEGWKKDLKDQFSLKGVNVYKNDAVAGFVNFIKSTSHSINLQPVIHELRATTKFIKESVGEHELKRLRDALDNHADDLAGFTNPLDLSFHKLFDSRRITHYIHKFNNLVQANMIVGNVGSLVGQLGGIPLNIARTGVVHSLKGAVRTAMDVGAILTGQGKNLPIRQSKFMRERYVHQHFERFNDKLYHKPGKLFNWALNTIDRVVGHFTWNGFYEKALAQKVKDPIRFADYKTREVLAGRGVGEVPLFHKSLVGRVFAPFSLEVGNQVKVLNRMRKGSKMDKANLITYMVAAYGINWLSEKLRGSSITFDPIDAVTEGYSQQDGGIIRKVGASIGSLIGETLGSVPGGSSVFGVIGDRYVPFTDHDLKYKDLMGKRDPNRFGNTVTLSKGVESPFHYLLPYGATQIDKAKKGYKAIKDEGIYNKSGKLKYPIDTGHGIKGAFKKAQMLAFGPGATKESRDYYKGKTPPRTLSGKDTLRVQNAVDKVAEYKQILQERKERAEKRKH